MATHAETILSLSKLEKLLVYRVQKTAKVFFAVAFTDKVCITELAPDRYYLKEFFRTQSIGNSNMFIAAWIPNEEITVIGDSRELGLKPSTNWV